MARSLRRVHDHEAWGQDVRERRDKPFERQSDPVVAHLGEEESVRAGTQAIMLGRTRGDWRLIARQYAFLKEHLKRTFKRWHSDW